MVWPTNYNGVMAVQQPYQDVISIPTQLTPLGPFRSSSSCDYAAWNYSAEFQEIIDLHCITLIDMVLSDPYAPNFSLLHECFMHQHHQVSESSQVCSEITQGYVCHYEQQQVRFCEQGKQKVSESKKSSTKRAKMGARRLSRKTISQHFYMPIKEAAKAMKVGVTHLKKRCRELGIRRWPRRKLMSLQTLINKLQEMGKEEGEEKMRKATKILKREKKLLEESPNMELQGETKRLRQACFKSNYKKRKLMEIENCCGYNIEDDDDDDWEEFMSFLSDP